MNDQISVTWRLRNELLPPVAVVALGTAAHSIIRRCLARDDAFLSALRGVSIKSATVAYDSDEDGCYGVVIEGPSDLLPWANGAFYLGRDARAPSLLLPTMYEPDVPLALFESALRQQLTDASGFSPPPWVVWPAQHSVISLADARPLDRVRLEEWVQSRFPDSGNDAKMASISYGESMPNGDVLPGDGSPQDVSPQDASPQDFMPSPSARASRPGEEL